MNLTVRNKQLIIVMVAVAIAAVGAYFGYDSYQAVAAEQTKTKQVEADLAMENKELDNLRELSNTMEDMSVEINDAKEILPDNVAIPELFTNLEAIAIDSEMTFNSVSIGGSSLGDFAESTTVGAITGQANLPEGVQTLVVTVSLTGGYDNLRVYLNNIEKNMRLMDVQSIEIGGEDVYSIVLNTYYVE